MFLLSDSTMKLAFNSRIARFPSGANCIKSYIAHVHRSRTLFQGDERGAERDLVIDNQRFVQLLVAEGILVFCASGVKRVAQLFGLEL